MPNSPMSHVAVTEMTNKTFHTTTVHPVLGVPWRFRYPHFKDGKTEAQRGYLLKVKQATSWDLNSSSVPKSFLPWLCGPPKAED